MSKVTSTSPPSFNVFLYEKKTHAAYRVFMLYDFKWWQRIYFLHVSCFKVWRREQQEATNFSLTPEAKKYRPTPSVIGIFCTNGHERSCSWEYSNGIFCFSLNTFFFAFCIFRFLRKNWLVPKRFPGHLAWDLWCGTMWFLSLANFNDVIGFYLLTWSTIPGKIKSSFLVGEPSFFSRKHFKFLSSEPWKKHSYFPLILVV